MAEPGQVSLVNPDGELVYVPHDQAQEAFAQGFTSPDKTQQAEIAKREQYGQGLGNELRAGAEGALRGVLPIGADTLLSQFADPEGIRERKERNPISSNVGMAAGLAGSAALAPESLLGRVGVGGISKVGGLAEKLVAKALEGGGETVAAKVAAKALTKGAGSAVEGAFYGLGEAVSEDALGEHDFTAQRVLAHVGMGAVFGGGVGSGLAALGEVAGPLAGKAADALQEKIAASPALREKLEEISGDRALMAAGVSKKYYKKLLGTDIKGLEGTALEGEDLTLFDEASRLMREHHIVKAGDTPEKVAEKLSQKMEDTRQGILKFTDDLDSVVDKQAARGDVMVGDRVLKGGVPQVNLREYAEKLRQEIAEPLKERPNMEGTYERVMKEATKYDELADKGGDLISFKKAEQLKRDFDQVYEKNAFGGAADTPVNKALKQARGILNGEIEDKARSVAESLGPEAFSGWKALKRDYQALSLVEKAAKDRSAAILTNRKISPSDYGSAIAAAALAGHATSGPVGALAALGTALAHKVVRERGNSVVSDLANRVSKLAFLEKASQSVSRQISEGVESFVSSLGSAKKLVAPASVGALHNVFFHDSEPDKTTSKSRQDAFKARLAELGQVVANPELASQKLSATMGTLESAAPKVAMLLGARAVNAAGFLFSKAPKAPDTGGMLADHAAWHPNDAEISKWERYAHAVQRPMSVLDDLRHGHISPEAVEALRVVYPKIYSEVATQLVPKLAAQKNIPFATRMQLSTLFGAPIDSLAKPDFIAGMQKMHAAAQISTGPAKTPPIASKSAILNSSQTPLQRAINRT